MLAPPRARSSPCSLFRVRGFPMRCRAVLALALSALLLAALPAAAQAQPCPAQIGASTKAGVELANGAVDAFRDGKYEEAITRFEKAEQVFHAPSFLLYVARSQVKLGRLVAAKGPYERIAKEQLIAYAPAEFFDAQIEAKKEL